MLRFYLCLMLLCLAPQSSGGEARDGVLEDEDWPRTRGQLEDRILWPWPQGCLALASSWPWPRTLSSNRQIAMIAFVLVCQA